MDTQQEGRNPDAAAEPAKSDGEQIIITAQGELHILAAPIQIFICGETYLKSQGRLHLVADHVLDTCPAGCHLAKPAGAREE